MRADPLRAQPRGSSGFVQPIVVLGYGMSSLIGTPCGFDRGALVIGNTSGGTSVVTVQGTITPALAP
ncbi:hypothetical protein OG401_30325 [Kitasatospora purpeofusca]|uniref:hypothetical protein n=1 Tax=Kitasatospora TaxID=2063 RepID=UPI0022533C37|nr:hypothetical protein [Kitasatospora purpeofusca]MCX4688545.1 hypothetical protein [Kitasatospora purpeofusca]